MYGWLLFLCVGKLICARMEYAAGSCTRRASCGEQLRSAVFTVLFWNVILAKDMKNGNISNDSASAVLLLSTYGAEILQVYLIYKNERERM